MYFSHVSMNTCISCPHARGCTPHAPCTCIRTYSYPCTCPLSSYLSFVHIMFPPIYPLTTS